MIKLLEEYVGLAKNGNNTVVLYKNPSQADYKEMGKAAADAKRKLTEIRYIADSKTKTVWVADAYVADHHIMHDIAKLDSSWAPTPHRVEGAANVIENKFAVANTYWDDYRQYAKRNGSDAGPGPLPEVFFPIFHTDWSFTNRYVRAVQSVVDSYKEKYIKILNKKELLDFNNFKPLKK